MVWYTLAILTLGRLREDMEQPTGLKESWKTVGQFFKKLNEHTLYMAQQVYSQFIPKRWSITFCLHKVINNPAPSPPSTQMHIVGERVVVQTYMESTL